MAWSDRVMGRLHPSQPQKQVLVHHEKPGGPIHRASRTRQPGLNLFAKLLRPSDAAPQSAETLQVQGASSEPVQPIAARLLSAGAIVNAKPADAAGATNQPPEPTLVSATSLASAAQDTAAQDTGTQGPGMQDTGMQATGATSWFGRGADGRFGASVGLALCTLFSLLSWGWFRRRAQIATTVR
ncbi:hypothetical protein [Bradyrhizobium sp.]|uniref:hypothetical protein n=1 Tax=Bradyrhizobium sp. TaxID=376 RepID=UPI003C4B0110